MSLMDSLASSNHWHIGVIGGIGVSLIALSASSASLACWLISLISLTGVLIHWSVCHHLAAVINTAITIS
jgi:hypothetical protein